MAFLDRRDFVRSVALGAVAAGVEVRSSPALQPQASGERRDSGRAWVAGTSEPRVGLAKGSDRRGNMLRALEMIEADIRRGLGNRQVVIKPNLTRVRVEEQLASTHVDAVRAICEVVSSFYKGKILIAEGTGPGVPIKEALDSFGYLSLKERFNVEFVDLQQDAHFTAYVLDRDVRPVALRVSRLLCDPGNYVISAAVMKTHSLAAVTLGLKNLVMAVPMNFGRGDNDRAKMHMDSVSADPRYFNFNLFQVSQKRVPDLVAIDGFVGMEGDGPLTGDPIESQVAIAATDWLAADRVATEVMGFDFSRIGHYRYCADAGMGEANLQKIRILGQSIGDCRKPYKPPSSIEKILI